MYIALSLPAEPHLFTLFLTLFTHKMLKFEKNILMYSNTWY